MSKVFPTQLAAKVYGRNLVHAKILHYQPIFVAALEPFIGCKVQNVGGALSKRFMNAMPKIEDPELFQVYVTSSDYGIRAEFRSCLTVKGSNAHMPDYNVACYTDTTLYLGELVNGVLVKVEDKPPQLRTDYTEAEVLAARAELKHAQEALSAAQSKLYCFGEYDR